MYCAPTFFHSIQARSMISLQCDCKNKKRSKFVNLIYYPTVPAISVVINCVKFDCQESISHPFHLKAEYDIFVSV